MRRRRWDLPEQPLPKHPYRDTVLVYGGMAIVLVLIAWATDGPVQRAVIAAVLFFVIATAFSWSRWYRRIRDEARQQAVRR